MWKEILFWYIIASYIFFFHFLMVNESGHLQIAFKDSHNSYQYDYYIVCIYLMMW